MNCTKCKGTVFTFRKRTKYTGSFRGLKVAVDKASFWECNRCKGAVLDHKTVNDVVNAVVQVEAQQNERYPHRKIPDHLPKTADEVCCEDMFRQMTQNIDCTQHGYNCPDRGIHLNPGYQDDEDDCMIPSMYLLRAPNASYKINFCPWCATVLSTDSEAPRMMEQ